MESHLINILSRTSNRPKAFGVFMDSLMPQTYKNVRLIVSADDANSFDYCSLKIRNSQIANQIIQPKRTERDPNKKLDMGYAFKLYHAPYNLYENLNIDKVEQGFVMYLDDDDKFSRPDALQIIANNITSEDDLIMWKVNLVQAGKIVPEPDYFGKQPVCGRVSGIGFSFHSKWKDYAVWDEFSCCDFRVIYRLFNIIPRIVLIDEVLTETQGIGNGNRIDIG